MIPPHSTSELTLEEALQLFKLSTPFTRNVLMKRFEEVRRVWHPARYAGLTNNPGKYMEMYKKGEAKTKEIQLAYQLLLNYLQTEEQCSSPALILEQPPEDP
jgi:hypothetical protein